MSENSQSRRDFIKCLAVTGGCVSLIPYAAWSKKSTFTKETSDFLKKFGPVNYHIDPRDENHFFGDQPHLKAHPVLWDKEAFLKTN